MSEMKYKCIGFDADDTLWENENYFRETEQQFAQLVKPYCKKNAAIESLLNIEIDNLKDYGYGVKGFVLSMIEAAIQVSEGKVSNEVILEIIELGKAFLNKPVVLLDGIETVLEKLYNKGYLLIMATKGDLLDQERKLAKSGLSKYFHHIEVMSDKKEENYEKLLCHLEIESRDLLMVGNSLKSDILPVVNLGGSAVHIPYHTTWVHENVELDKSITNYWELESISQLIAHLQL